MPRGVYKRKKKAEIKPVEPQTISNEKIEEDIPTEETYGFPVKISLFRKTDKGPELVITYPVHSMEEMNEAKMHAQRKGFEIEMR